MGILPVRRTIRPSVFSSRLLYLLAIRARGTPSWDVLEDVFLVVDRSSPKSAVKNVGFRASRDARRVVVDAGKGLNEENRLGYDRPSVQIK